MICFPNCKINLGLFVTHRREDGYHDIETVFYPVEPPRHSLQQAAGAADGYTTVLNDVLEIVPAANGITTLHLSGLAVDGEVTSNLVWKAYNLLVQDYGSRIPPLDIYLHKATPMGAGLGGGSADGAYMLRLLNDYCGLNIGKEKLIAYALLLGSDCPFFIVNTPQFATGRGEQMTPVAADLSGYDIRIVCPGIHVSTRDAFAAITPRTAPFDLRNIASLPVSEWKDHITNDFETTVFKIHPELERIKQQLYDAGAVYASMTGTGSAVYGIFPR